MSAWPASITSASRFSRSTESLEFYRDAVGLEPESPRHRSGGKSSRSDAACRRTRIELLEATSDDSPIARFLAKRGEGLHHIAMRVPDLDAAVDRLKAAGSRLVTEQIQTGAEGYRYVFVHPKSAHGVLLELIEES